METLIIKIAAVVVAVGVWMITLWVFERGARKKTASPEASDQIEPVDAPSPIE